MGVLASY